jgi:hypothetical protein
MSLFLIPKTAKLVLRSLQSEKIKQISRILKVNMPFSPFFQVVEALFRLATKFDIIYPFDDRPEDDQP